jgi:hypothetical protein
LRGIDKSLFKDWKPAEKDLDVIKRRVISKINLKPTLYGYYVKDKGKSFFADYNEAIKNFI